MNTKPNKVIYARWLAVELQDRGFPIVSTGKNPFHPQYDCYFFEDTTEFQLALTKILQKK